MLSGAQAEYASRAAAGAPSAADAALERVIFALVALFVCRLDDPLIVGFRSLVPMVTLTLTLTLTLALTLTLFLTLAPALALTLTLTLTLTRSSTSTSRAARRRARS